MTCEPEDMDRAVVEQIGAAARVEGTERRLDVGLVGDQPAEHVVDEVDDRRGRTEVGGQHDLVGADLVGGAEVLGDVGTAEPVDRLFRVADDEQPARFGHELTPVGVVGRVVGREASRTAISSWIGSVSWNSSSMIRW